MIHDAQGVEIKVGDVVVYPGRQSSSVWVSKAIVEEIIDIDEDRRALKCEVIFTTRFKGRYNHELPRKVTLTAFHNMFTLGSE
jgi:hypothetical protein